MTKDKIALLLAQGIPAANIASIVGCTPGYISQLCKEEAFKELITKHRIETVPAKSDEELLSTKYESMEHRLLNAMEAALPGAELRDITHALKTVADRQNARQKARIPVTLAGTNGNTTINVVQIAIPAHAIPTLSFNNKNEVVAIDNRPMAPMASKAVSTLFEQMKARREAKEVTDAHEIPMSSAPAQLAVPEDF